MQTTGMGRRLRSILLLVSSLCISIAQGCAVFSQPPSETDRQAHIAAVEHPFPPTRPIPARAGIFLNDQLKKYVYRGQRGGQTVQMNVGEQLASVSRQMVSAIFQDPVFVETSPPRAGGYGADIGAIVEPEITYFGVSTANPQPGSPGPVEAKVRMRITIYDLGGKVLWQDETSGEGTGALADYPSRGTGGLQGETERICYEALFSAASRSIHDLNAQAPAGLYAVLDPGKLPPPKGPASTSDAALLRRYREKGQTELDRKNYHQALYWLEKAERVSPGDPSTQFYTGVCRVYVGQRSKGLEHFTRIIREYPGSRMAKDSAKWVETIKNPLKIGIVVIDKDKGTREMTLPGDNIVQRAIRESGAYKAVDVTDLRPPLNLKNKKGFNAFLDRCARKGLAILICVYADKLEIKTFPQGTAPGDSAKEFSTVASAQAFSTKKKQMHSHVSVRERISVLVEKTGEERDGIRNELLRRASGRLVLKLLARDII